MRTSYVQINGQLHLKTGNYSTIIDGVNWYCIAGRWMPEGQVAQSAPMVMPDIAPYKSTIDGSEITSRSRHREHLRAHGCIEVGNERPKPFTPTYPVSEGLRQELIARFNK